MDRGPLNETLCQKFLETLLLGEYELKTINSFLTADDVPNYSTFWAFYDILVDKSEFDYITFDITCYDENREKIVTIGSIAGVNASKIQASATVDFSYAKYYTIGNIEYYKNVDMYHSIQVFPKKSGDKQLYNEVVKSLIPGEEYVIAIIKEIDAIDLFASNNLCYIMQTQADSNGEINLECYVSIDTYNVCVYGKKREEISATPTVTPNSGSIAPPDVDTPNEGMSGIPSQSIPSTPNPTVTPSVSMVPTPDTEANEILNPDVTLAPGTNSSEKPDTTIVPTLEPITEPKITPSPSVAPTMSSEEKQLEATQRTSEKMELPKKNMKLLDIKTGNVYKVIKVKKTVDLVKVSDKAVSVKIPAKIKLKGIIYQVMGIEKNAFKQIKNSNKISVQIPKNKYAAYRRMLQNRGIGKKVRIVKA